MTTNNKQKAAELRAMLALYRSLAMEFPDGMTAKSIRFLSAEVEEDLRKHGEDAEPLFLTVGNRMARLRSVTQGPQERRTPRSRGK